MKFALTALLVSLLASSLAIAQQPAPPSGPLLKRAPDYSAWTIAYSSPVKESANSTAAVQAPTPPPSRKIEVTKTGDLRHVVINDTEGRKTDLWIMKGLQAILRPEWKEPLLSDGMNGLDAYQYNFGTTDFPGFEWISARNFKGVQKIGERDCFIFQDKVQQVDGQAPLESGDGPLKTAIVDSLTRLPVKLDNGGEVATFTFQEGRPPAQTLPTEVQKAIDTRAQKIKELSRPPARPF